MKNKISKLLIAGLALTAFTACGSDKKESSSPAGEKKTTIRLAHWDAEQQPGLQLIIDEFKKANPNIDVVTEVSPWGQYWTKLETTTAGGTSPDVFWINAPQFQRYAKNGQIAPLDDLVAAGTLDPKNYVPAMVNTYTIDGKLYAVPKDIDSIALWYNKEIFDKAGATYPNENWTWDDLVGAAEKIKSNTGNFGLSMQLQSGQESYWNMIYANGGYVVSSDKKKSGYSDPKTLDAIIKMRDLIDKKLSPSLVDLVEINASDTFTSGKAGMMFGGTWRMRPFMTNEFVKDKIDIALLPKLEKRTSIVHGLGYAVYAKSKNIDAAKKFVAFLGSKEANEMQAKHIGTIPAFMATQSGWATTYPNVNMKAYLDIMADGTPYPATYDFAKWFGPTDDILRKVWSQEMSPEDAVKAITPIQQQVLDNEKN